MLLQLHNFNTSVDCVLLTRLNISELLLSEFEICISSTLILTYYC